MNLISRIELQRSATLRAILGRKILVLGLMGTDTVSGLAEAYQSKKILGTNGSLLYVTNDTVNDGNDGDNYAVVLTVATGTITARR